MISPAGTTAVELDRRLTFGSDSYPFTVCAGPGAWDDLARMFRGALRLFHIPTTLLALSDSVVSRKQAANMGGKNTVGAFKTPAGVWANLDVLRHLPSAEFRAAMCEGAKNIVAIVPGRA